MPGRFVTLEGGEGVGKSTQAKALAAALRQRGIEVVVTREPGGSPGAEAIRALLLEGEIDRWSAGAEALLFAAARSDHVARTIKPALERGDWVLCDRFLDSSSAYQGLVGGLGVEAIRRFHEIGSGGFLPDRTLLLRLEGGEATDRAARRDGHGSDRFGARDSAYHASIAAAFDALAAAEPERIRIVDASGAPETVTRRLMAALEDLL
jgi:dTMP kinase